MNRIKAIEIFPIILGLERITNACAWSRDGSVPRSVASALHIEPPLATDRGIDPYTRLLAAIVGFGLIWIGPRYFSSIVKETIVALGQSLLGAGIVEFCDIDNFSRLSDIGLRAPRWSEGMPPTNQELPAKLAIYADHKLIKNKIRVELSGTFRRAGAISY